MNAQTILVVEDEGIIAKDIRAMLMKLGYAVPEPVSTGEEAIVRATELRPNLVLMDIMLAGDMDGVVAARHIRKELQIPVVFLSSHSDSMTLQRAKLSEPYGYVSKPLAERELRIGIEMALHKHKMERQQAEREHWFSHALSSIGEAVIATDPQGIVRFINPLAETITGWSAAEATGQHLYNVFVLVTRLDDNGLLARTLSEGLAVDWSGNHALTRRQGSSIPLEYTAARIRHPSGEVLGVVVIFRDITVRKQWEKERERLVKELQDTVNNVKVLRGMLPICSVCKKVRDDKGYWERVDAYVQKHTEATFSHGLCPDCMREVYPDIAEQFFKELADKQTPTVRDNPLSE